MLTRCRASRSVTCRCWAGPPSSVARTRSRAGVVTPAQLRGPRYLRLFPDTYVRRIGIEYEGIDHTRPEGVLRDVGRYTRLVDDGRRVYRFTKYEVYGRPDEIAATIGRASGIAPRWR
jgi:hypothetical protein